MESHEDKQLLTRVEQLLQEGLEVERGLDALFKEREQRRHPHKRRAFVALCASVLCALFLYTQIPTAPLSRHRGDVNIACAEGDIIKEVSGRLVCSPGSESGVIVSHGPPLACATDNSFYVDDTTIPKALYFCVTAGGISTNVLSLGKAYTSISDGSLTVSGSGAAQLTLGTSTSVSADTGGSITFGTSSTGTGDRINSDWLIENNVGFGRGLRR